MNFDLFKIAWKNPREAVQFVLSHKFSAYWFVLLLAGSGDLLLEAIEYQGNWYFWLLIVLAFVLAIPFVWIGTAISAILAHVIAKYMFGGLGTYKDMRKGLYVTYLPLIFEVPLALIAAILFYVPGVSDNALAIVIGIVSIVLSIVMIVLQVIVMSEVEQISIGKSIGVLIVGTIIVFILAFFVIMVLGFAAVSLDLVNI